MNKICGACKTEKDEEEFYWKNKSKGLRQSHCESCKKEYREKWYAKNKKRHIKNVRDLAIINRQDLREKLWDYLTEHPCVDCGESDPVVLEFDHQRDKKTLVSIVRCWRLMKEEMEKCEVRCANCHRRRTAIQLGWWKAKKLH